MLDLSFLERGEADDWTGEDRPYLLGYKLILFDCSLRGLFLQRFRGIVPEGIYFIEIWTHMIFSSFLCLWVRQWLLMRLVRWVLLILILFLIFSLFREDSRRSLKVCYLKRNSFFVFLWVRKVRKSSGFLLVRVY